MRTENENKIKINFIRHGKTPLNELHCYVGSTDENLSENGKKELREKVIDGIYEKPEKVFTSNLKRTIETAMIIYPGTTPTEINEFRETDFGSFEGKNYNDLKDFIPYRIWIDRSRGATEEELKGIYSENDLAYYESLKSVNDEDESVNDDVDSPNHDRLYANKILPEDSESVKKRVVEGLKKVLSLSGDKDTISVVAHGGTIQTLASFFLKENPYNYMVSCGEGITVEVTYRFDNGNIEISCFSIVGRIHS